MVGLILVTHVLTGLFKFDVAVFIMCGQNGALTGPLLPSSVQQRHLQSVVLHQKIIQVNQFYTGTKI